MIPIYRAKKLDSDEWVEGYLMPFAHLGGYFIRESEYGFLEEAEHQIDQNTLAIHFPNMIDKNGKKIFASLSEDGVGGDEVILKEVVYVNFTNGDTKTRDRNGIVIFSKDCVRIDCRELETLFAVIGDVEVIGTHKGES